MTKTTQKVARITDVDPTISNDVLKIEINGHWRKFSAADFFDFLSSTGRLDGHDPTEQTALVHSPVHVRFNPATDEPEEYESPWAYSTHSYEYWLKEFIDNDALLLEYIRSAPAVK